MLYPIILGVVQGIAEFLPISSSAHLIITSWLMEGEPLSLSLNVSLHMGTLFAVLLYFHKDWLELFSGLFSDIQQKRYKNGESIKKWTILVIASLPAGILGLTLKDTIEQLFHNPTSTVGPLVIVGIALWWIDKKAAQSNKLQDMTIFNGIMIGCAQACALIPGVSRSGATITAARLLNFDRETATRFSFLLGTPAMGGAALLHYKDILANLSDSTFQIGVFVSCLVGCLAIHFLMSWIRKAGFGIFAIYRVLLATLIVAISTLG